MKQKRQVKRQQVVSACLILILVLVMLYSGLRILEATVFYDEPSVDAPVQTKTILHEGKEYFPRQDITVMMVLGIDQYGPVESSGYHRNHGAADSVMLCVFDETQEVCNVLYLNRDTMVQMDVLGLRGEYAGTAYGQLALAHTYGTGMEDSCENMKNTLENFLHGLDIDYYVSMNMDAITLLNDAVGGVTVTVTEDFSQVNPHIKMGQMTLRGDQALDFVRTRKDVGDQLNVTRIERQKVYVDSFLRAFYEKIGNETDFMVTTYNQVAPYIVTDCSATTLSSMWERYGTFEIQEVLSPEGENLVEDGHYAFYVQEDALEDLILRLFYREKKF